MRRTPKLTAEVRRIAEEHLLAHGVWPWSFSRVFEGTGLSPVQIRDALFDAGADEWRREALKRFQETK